MVAESARAQSGAKQPLSSSMLGVWIFIASESLFFGSLIAGYLYLRIRAGAWPPPGVPPLDILLPLVNTIVLFSSAVTMHGAHMAWRAGDQGGFARGVVATIVLGAGFLLGQVFEYTHAGFGLADGLLGSTFYTLTGFHGAHVLIGLLALVMVLVKSQRGHFKPGVEYSSIEGGVLYWHFVDAVWVAVLTVIYLI